jgi:hypothetical protein
MLAQSYETTIFDHNATTGLHFFVLPARSRKTPLPNDGAELAKELGMSNAVDVRPAFLAHALTALIPRPEPGPAVAEPYARLEAAYNAAASTPEFSFAQEVAFSRIVPWEGSPLSAESLAGIMTGGGAVAIGAKLGIVALGAAASGPALLFAAASGVFVIIAASEVGKGVGNALSAKIRSWMGVPPPANR